MLCPLPLERRHRPLPLAAQPRQRSELHDAELPAGRFLHSAASGWTGPAGRCRWLRRADTVKAAAAALDRSRGFIYDSLRRRQRQWASAHWVAYGAELRRRRLLAGWSVAQLSRRINLSGMTIHHIEKGRGQSRPSDLTLAKLAAAVGMPTPPLGGAVDDKTKQDPPLK